MSSKLVLAAAGLALAVALSATPAAAQIWFFPVYALPMGGDAPTSYVAASYGRGLNDESGKVDAFGAAFGHAAGNVSFSGAAGLATGEGDDELTLGANVGVPIVRGESATFSVQGGIGWIAVEVLGETLTSLWLPVGVAVQTSVDSGEAVITPWAMPRLNIVHARVAGESNTETDFGASAGVSFNFPGGFGVHTALDVVVADGGEPVLFGIGGHYVIGSN